MIFGHERKYKKRLPYFRSLYGALYFLQIKLSTRAIIMAKRPELEPLLSQDKSEGVGSDVGKFKKLSI